MLTQAELEALKVPELKAECQKLGLPVSGKKQELVDRILLAQQEVPAEAAAPTAGAAQEPDAAAAAEAEPADANGHRKHKAIEWAPKAAAAEPAAPAGDAADATAPEAAAEPQAGEEAAAGEDGAKVADLKAVAALTDAERAKLRAERFKGQFEPKAEVRLKERAARFGLPDPEADEEKKAKRRERFGNETDSDKKAKQAADIAALKGDDETRKKREAKFGKATESSASLVDPAKLKERQERFGVASLNDEARKKARADRFKEQ